MADLENFKTRTRSTVSVRQGQGMVLLCGPPPHSGGKAIYFFCFEDPVAICNVFILRLCFRKFKEQLCGGASLNGLFWVVMLSKHWGRSPIGYEGRESLCKLEQYVRGRRHGQDLVERGTFRSLFIFDFCVCIFWKKRLKVVVRVTFVHNLFTIILIFQTLVTVFALWVLSFC